ncbi:MAG TPA: HlyD family efflux transporter periplasmic adaptor subunit [Kofleriaceae bacterium]|jgi:HlyD family secretion protein|nr:HlyD family efflux transporter periplasmic adaptor subunit [Kofleriaceae bacterium]
MINNLVGLLWIAAALGCNKPEKYPGAYQGTVEYEETDLGFEVGGRIREIKVARGAEVPAGSLVASLDDTLERAAHVARMQEVDVARSQLQQVKAGSRPEEMRALRAQITAARANEDLLKKNTERHKFLVAHDASTQAQVDEYESRWRAATAERLSLEHRLRDLEQGARAEEVGTAEARTRAADAAAELEAKKIELNTLRAPAGGTVVDIHVEPGEVVAAGVPVITVTDLHRPYADVFVPQGEASGLRIGTAAQARVDALTAPLAAHIEYVWPRAEFTPRYLFSERERPNLVTRVRVRIDDPKAELVAGLPVFVTLGTP